MMHPVPLKLWKEFIQPEWIDFNKHMNVAYYTLVFDHAADAFFDYIELGREYRKVTTGSTFAVEHHIQYNREVVEGDEVFVESLLIGFDEKRLHHYHEMYNVNGDYLAATCEFLSLHVDLKTRRVTPIPENKLGRIYDIGLAHKSSPKITNLGNKIKVLKPAH